ncbi:MAG: hypothetical protein QM270_02300 [Bacillota bacterium]|nr:hypothetical protein [Bacillota bacterium]
MNRSKRRLYVWVPGAIIAVAYLARLALFTCLLLFSHSIDPEKLDPLTSPNQQLEAGLAIIAIAISVWIGLNIYTYIEKNELERLDQDTHKMREQMSSFVAQQKLDFLKELGELRKYSDGTVIVLHEVFLSELANQRSKYTYESEIYDMLYALKVYAQAFHMYRSEGEINKRLENLLQASIDKLMRHKLGAVYRYYVHFLCGELSFFSKKYAKAKEQFESSLNEILDESNTQEKIDIHDLTTEQAQIIIESSIGWTIYLRDGMQHPEKALPYFEKKPKNNEVAGIVYDESFLSRYYRNRGVFLEKLGEFALAQREYEEALTHQSELYYDVKAAYAYTSIVMKIWDFNTKKSSVSEWFHVEKSIIDTVQNECGNVETQLIHARSADSTDAGIYIQYAKMLMYKALIMNSEDKLFIDIIKIANEASSYLQMAEQLLCDKEKYRTEHTKRDIHCALYLICMNNDRICEAVDHLKEALSVLDKMEKKNDEAKNMALRINELLLHHA